VLAATALLVRALLVDDPLTWAIAAVVAALGSAVALVAARRPLTPG
jgi:hypothetical protein